MDNELCPCGSEKMYKDCCKGKQVQIKISKKTARSSSDGEDAAVNEKILLVSRPNKLQGKNKGCPCLTE